MGHPVKQFENKRGEILQSWLDAIVSCAVHFSPTDMSPQVEAEISDMFRD